MVEFVTSNLRNAANASNGFQRTLIKSKKFNINILNDFDL